jgi:hypothetical protein
MKIKLSFEDAGALEKSTVKKEEGNIVIILKENFPSIEYDAKNLQYPKVIGADIDPSGDEFLDATKRDENAIKYFEEKLRDIRAEAKHRLEIRELEREKKKAEEKKNRESTLLGMLPLEKDDDF